MPGGTAMPGRGHTHHSHSHKHNLLYEPQFKDRNCVGQLICPPITDKLPMGENLIAKVRYTNRDTCSAKLEAKLTLTTTADPCHQTQRLLLVLWVEALQQWCLLFPVWCL